MIKVFLHYPIKNSLKVELIESYGEVEEFETNEKSLMRILQL